MKELPFTRERIEALTETHPTPFHLYDEKGIRENAKAYLSAFAWCSGFKQYYAVKAAPTPAILEILRDLGMGADCSSLAELMLAEQVGMTGENIMFTSNNTPIHEYEKAIELGAIINLDDISHIAYLEEHLDLPNLISFRYNPGPLRSGNAIIGDPAEAKYGLTRDQLFEGYAALEKSGVKRFGLHTMVVSNELDEACFLETAEMLFDLVVEVKERLGIELEFVNLGGGVGVPYRPEDQRVDVLKVSTAIKSAYDERVKNSGMPAIEIFTELGRYITGPYGYLITRVLHFKDTYKQYAGVDACMANLMRPAMYGAYHHITVLGKEQSELTNRYDVTGSLCENNDKFAIDRDLPALEAGDLLAIHDAGAHGHSMGFNYNGKLRSAELLLKEDGRVEMIRRAETLEDHFATLTF
jgi:diaminopimelate decarboxylase